MFAFDVLDLVFLAFSQKINWGNASQEAYLVSGGT